MSLQGITVAISPSGIKYFTSLFLTNAIQHAVDGLTPPSKTIPVGDILFASGKYGTSSDVDIKINLSSGSLSGFSPDYLSQTQGDNGAFSLVLKAGNFKANYKWNETYHMEHCYIVCSNMGNVNNTYNYSVGFSSLTLIVDFKFAFANNKWGFNFVSVSDTAAGISPNIPKNSVVNGQESAGCFQTKVSDATKDAVQSIDFNTSIQKIIPPLFKSIPSSGNLTPDIVFEFPLGPSGLTFPKNAGIATGVTGNVTYKGKSYPGTNPPSLALPDVPASEHLRYYASDYVFNGLFWAFFKSGDLKATATSGNVPDPATLNTANYKNTPMQALYNKYPDMPMTADIAANTEPTVSFSAVYDLTKAAMVELKTKLPPAIYTKLKSLVGDVFLSEANFYTQLENVLGKTEAGTYKAIIEPVVKTTGAIVTHNINVTLNVIDQGTTIPVIVFSVMETDVLRDLKLGISGNTQTLQFTFHLIPTLTSAKLISSTVSGIDATSFPFMWNFVLQAVFSTELEKMGKTGVALPRMPGFDFLFDKATIAILPGYVDVLTDVQHVSDSGIKYLLSKDTIELDHCEDWEPTYHKHDPEKYAVDA